ncbi:MULTISPECIES: hypothetical protein [Legionella]|uniref:Chromosome partition protein Smc n=1 Tax=Legionella resiliens TaxID=2905958 RepID=A0ABS8X2R3_9GAMM|nr:MULTISPECIES: hypothetical protein [unclassified Legionella]MCE0723111.1 hypothetical protein [Legionella sp. 9fVS26]MCE3532264.1 hypothetical protein [Legionella sp. 8cVS16]QLZ68393.1 hypothetical protein FOLKNPGA_01171 [Legionella sp. PC1000]
MTRLEELIYALTTVIVRYHDSQDNIATKDKLVAALEPTTRRKKSHERAVEIIQDTKINFAPYLEGKINACTGGYQARKEFLSFILNEISYLKEQLDRKTPLNSEELQTLQEQLTQLFIDFRQLLNIKKGFKHSVTLNNSKGSLTRELFGLLNDRYVGGKYCNSGQLLIDEVLFVLHMTTDDSNDELKDIATNICLEQQLFLESQRNKLKKATEESGKDNLKLETETLKLESSVQKSKLEAQQLELESQKSKLEAQQLELVSQKLKIEEQRSELEQLADKQKSGLEPQLQELTEINKVQQATIEELTKDLEKTKAELQKAKEARRFPPYTPFYGSLAALSMLQSGTNPRFFQQQPTTTSSQSIPKPENFEDNMHNLSIE